MSPEDRPATPFHSLDALISLRRVSSLWLAPDGCRLVAAVQQPDASGKRYVSSLWEIDPSGAAPARRLTRGVTGEMAAGFLPDGSMVFVAERTDTTEPEDADHKAAVWVLPSGGGEARRLAGWPGGVRGVVVARDAGALVLSAPVWPGTADAGEDTAHRTARADTAVSAILHESFPVRHWDHDLGPDQVRLFAVASPAGEEDSGELRDLTPTPGRALDDAAFDVAPDGRTVVTTWRVPVPGGDRRAELVAIDVATGDHRTLAGDPDHDYLDPRISPDGQDAVCVRVRRSRTDDPPDRTLWLLPLAEVGGGRDLTPGLDLWPIGPHWAPDGGRVYFTADQEGRSPVFAVGVDSGRINRLAGGAAYTAVSPSLDGRWVYALRSAIDAPPAPVRLAADRTDQEPQFLRGPDASPALPGHLTEIEADTADGTSVRAWLVLPDEASAETPTPLILWVHGGPLLSWNAWMWRWNPWLMAARGYAVLLPDPALSTGYGQEFIRRGWGRWGAEPFADLMTITDAACARPDVDERTTAVMGGSFGGYMANWIAGHTDRFDAIVTHASLWALDQFIATGDMAAYWSRELTSDRVETDSPHRHAQKITTPMLVIHGGRDYRVPIGDALRLWWDLCRNHKGDSADFPHRFLYYPDENHWILTPHHAKIWYETVFAFFAWHLHGKEWRRPELL